MRVVHVETGTNLYGGALQVLYLLEGLNEHQVENVLVCPDSSKIGSATQGLANKIYPVPMAGDLDLMFIFRLWRILRSERPDLLHLHSRRGADVLGGIAGRLAGIPVVLSRRVDNPEGGTWTAIKYRLYRKVITISQNIREVLLQAGVPAHKVVCVPSAVDVGAYGHSCDRLWFESEFGLPPQAKVCAIIAQLIPRKGHRYLLEAFQEISEALPNCHLLVFGKGPLENKLQQQCHHLGIESRVHFLGFRKDLARYLCCVDVVVHPAELEGLGVSLLQAAAAGVPIVATATGGIPEIVHHGVNGYLVPVGDIGGLTKHIISLLTNPELTQRLGAAGREIANKSFSIASMVQGNLRLYSELLDVSQAN
ncbi:MAG TPA: glycosyltransferase family 1 protein [Acidiferrobacteraceae bacterium]|nr:glycosyltransferase family 1 protein [Acidiferrobacteraceae bacterium]